MYSGANRPLWLLKKNTTEILEIKATKSAIGGYTLDDQIFAQHELVIEKGDSIYIFSDGFADQFGGESGKKMMTKRFKELLIENAHLDMKNQGAILSDYFKKWRGATNEQVDDVLIIGIRV
ncbi:MAG: SpoIIE family protein phosphatase [Bacteroidia bacterium]